jgi:Family of unknown function (DUF6488)
MKNIHIYLTMIWVLLFSTVAIAGAGDDCHFHGNKPASKEVVYKCADQRKAKLISRGKIESSWESVKPESITVIDGQKGKEWKVMFVNPAVSDKSKSNLYLFYSESGNFIAANHSGK